MKIVEALEILTGDEYANKSGDDRYWQELPRVLELQNYDGCGGWSMEDVIKDFDPELLEEAVELAEDFKEEQWSESPLGQIQWALTEVQTVEALSGRDGQGNSMTIRWHSKDQTWYWQGRLDGHKVSGDEQAGIYKFLELLEDYPELAQSLADDL